MGTLIIVEANKSGAEHNSFNSAMLETLLACANRAQTTALICCERTHREALLPSLGHVDNAVWRDIPVVSGLRRSFIRKWLVEVIVLFRIMVRAKRTGGSVVLLSAFPNALASIMLWKRLFRSVPMHVILHGELEALVIPGKQRIHREGFWVKLALFKLFDGTWPELYVLGAGIKQRLIHEFPEQKNLQAIRVIEHPYRFENAKAQGAPATHRTIVGFIGAGRRVKGIFQFFDLAASLVAYTKAGMLEFVVVGGIEKELRIVRRDDVRILAAQPAGLDAEQFRAAVANLSCAVFPYQHNYRFIASGAALDAINAGIEIFSLENRYLRDLSERDPEGGIKFFKNIEAIQVEIARRIDTGDVFRRFNYTDIKCHHFLDAVGASLERSIFPVLSDPSGAN